MDEYYCRCRSLLDRGMQRCRQRETWADSRDVLNKSAYMKFNHRKARTSKCRQEISKATELHYGLWRLDKWAKEKNQLTRGILKTPKLTHPFHLLHWSVLATFQDLSMLFLLDFQ